mmetsp:Transcript_20783/g.30765  ORF Transcript_20783/g.30765 Transcript_20783/m.30765 type:complete len:264 (-) Transcript_20783:331-1122(-)
MTGVYYSHPYSFTDWRMGLVKPCVIHKIEAPPSIVWEILSDIDSSVSIIPGCKSIEILSDYSQGGFKEGVRYKEVVGYAHFFRSERELSVYKTVFEVKEAEEDGSTPRSAKIAMTIGEDSTSAYVLAWDVHAVQEATSSTLATNLVLSFSIITGGVCNRFFSMLFDCFVHKVARTKLEQIALNVEKVALQKTKERESKKVVELLLGEEEETTRKGLAEEEGRRLAIEKIASQELKAKQLREAGTEKKEEERQTIKEGESQLQL